MDRASVMDSFSDSVESPKVREFIERIRSDPNRLDRPWRSDVYHLDVFRERTQALILQFRSPDLALIVFTTIADKEDLGVQTILSMPLSSVADELPAALTACEPLMFKWILGNGQVSLGQLLEHETKSLLQTAVQNSLFSGTGFRSYPPERVALFCYCGLVANMDVPTVLEREYACAQADRTRVYPSLVFFTPGRARKAFAGQFRTIEESKQSKTFRESLAELFRNDNNLWTLSKPLLKCVYNKVEIVIFGSGVVVADTSHQDLALECLNSFFAVSDFQGADCVPTTSPFDLGTVDVNEQGAAMSWGGPVRLSRNPITHGAINLALLDNCVALFKVAQRDLETLEQLRLRHSAKIHLMAGETLQGFMLAWTVVEREIRRLWKRTLNEKGVEKNREEKILIRDDFTTNQLIEIVEILGRLEPDLYARVQKLRKIRNDAVHRGATPTMEHGSECIRIANTFIQQKLPPNKPKIANVVESS